MLVFASLTSASNVRDTTLNNLDRNWSHLVHEVDGVKCIMVGIEVGDKNSMIFSDGIGDVIFDTSRYLKQDTGSFYRAAIRSRQFIGPKHPVRVDDRDREKEWIEHKVDSNIVRPVQVIDNELLLIFVKYQVKRISSLPAYYWWDPNSIDYLSITTDIPYDSLKVREYIKTLYRLPFIRAVGLPGFVDNISPPIDINKK